MHIKYDYIQYTAIYRCTMYWLQQIVNGMYSKFNRQEWKIWDTS